MANEVVTILLKAKDEATSEIKKVSNEVGGLGKEMDKLLGGAGAWGAIAAGAITAGAAIVGAGKKFADSVRDLDRVSRAAGTSTQNVQVLRQVFEEAGLGAEAADKALTFMAKSIGRGDPLLKAFNITTRDSFQAMMQVGTAYLHSADAATKVADAAKLMGKSAAQAGPALEELAAHGAETMDKMREAGLLYQGQTVEQALVLRKQLSDFDISWKGLWARMESAAVPTATSIVGKINEIMDALNRPVRQDDDSLLGFWKKARAAAEQRQGELDAVAQKKFAPGGDWTFSITHPPKTRALPKPKGKLIGMDEDGNPIYGDDSADTGAVKARTKRLADLRAEIGVSANQARAYLDILEQVERKKKGAAAMDELSEGLSGKKLSDLLAPGDGPGLRGKVPVAPMAPSGPVAQVPMAELPRNLRRVSDAMIDVGVKWGEVTNQILSEAGLVDAGFSALYSGLESGLSQVISNLGNKMQTLKSATATIFKSIADAALSELERIIVAKVFQIALNLLAPGTGSAAGAAMNFFAPGNGGGSTGGGGGGGGGAVITSAQRAGGNTYNIHALDYSTAIAAIARPSGVVRTANDRVRLGTTY